MNVKFTTALSFFGYNDDINSMGVGFATRI